MKTFTVRIYDRESTYDSATWAWRIDNGALIISQLHEMDEQKHYLKAYGPAVPWQVTIEEIH